MTRLPAIAAIFLAFLISALSLAGQQERDELLDASEGIEVSQLTRMALNPFNWFGRPAPIGDDFFDVSENEQAGRLYARAEELAEKNNLRSARRLSRQIVRYYRFADVAADALFLQATIEMTNGRWDRAMDLFQRIVNEYPGYENFNTVIRNQFDSATALQEGARSRILWIFPGFRQYNKARIGFERVIRNAPYSEYAPLSLMNIALIGRAQNRADVEIDALDRLINFYPDSFLTPIAYFALAEAYGELVQGAPYDQGSTREAISYFEDFLILFPESRDIGAAEAGRREMENILAESRLTIGDFYYYFRNNNTAALIFYNEAITVAPNSDAAAEARLRIADIEAGVQPVLGNRILRRLLFVP